MSDLTSVFQFLIGIPFRLFEVLASHTAFTAFGVSVNYVTVLLSFLVVFMVVGLFWKGARF